ncbi:MAG TPA: hypothetical protein VM735_05685 [Candidatus Kapabacteria bacterium]|nr:hypothetical protein [Candidatus Kapabacteria bacterium]
MKALILILTSVTLLAQAPAAPKPGASDLQIRPTAPPSANDAPKPEAFRDPFRKVKNAHGELVNADLRPLFAWFQKRRGERPMKVWGRTIVTTIENKPGGVLVRNNNDQKVFFLRNYPYNVAPNTVIQFFSVDSGFHTYKNASGASETVHAADYGVPYNPATEKKSAPAKKETGAVQETPAEKK